MDQLLEQALRSLVASGPIAIVLGVACWKLWNANREERERHATEEKALQDKVIQVLTSLTTMAKGDSHHD